MRECAFCGQPAETDEHVIPKWLQNHFDLFDQRLLLWNGTTMPYRQAIVPACLGCNRDRFSPLEKRIREGWYTAPIVRCLSDRFAIAGVNAVNRLLGSRTGRGTPPPPRHPGSGTRSWRS